MSDLYGKAVSRLIRAFPEGPQRDAYVAEREVAYQRLRKRYEDAGQNPPSRLALSAEEPTS